MTDETKDVATVDTTTTESSPETKGTDVTSDTKDTGLVPRERLNEEAAKRREAESAAKVAAEAAKEATSKIDALTKALTGADTKAEKDEVISSFAAEFGVPENFVNKLLDLTSKKINKSQKPDPALVADLAELRFTRELDALKEGDTKDSEEARSISREERSELKKRAIANPHTPLRTLFRDMMYDRKTEDKKTFEESRPGGKQATDDTPDFGRMTPEQMREWSSKNLSRRNRR